MKVLGIETSGVMGSVAVSEDDVVIKEQSLEEGMSHGRGLIATIGGIIEEQSWGPQDIELITVSAGPGSYTGLRVGVTCAKTLAYTMNKPVVAVPTLDVLAENAPEECRFICPVLDAKRASVYACIYKCINGVKERVTEFLVIPPGELLALLPRPVTVFGDGVNAYYETFRREGVQIGEEGMGMAKAGVVARLGRRIYEGGGQSNVETLAPLYLRKPAPIEKLESKL